MLHVNRYSYKSSLHPKLSFLTKHFMSSTLVHTTVCTVHTRNLENDSLILPVLLHYLLWNSYVSKKNVYGAEKGGSEEEEAQGTLELLFLYF